MEAETPLERPDTWIASDAEGRTRQREFLLNVLRKAEAQGLKEDNPVLAELRKKLHRLGN
jgi:UTP:GlnB (protein PII) uridylyltransferase